MTRRVAVLGAGIAGLVAAQQLRRNGIEVVVYEAGPRIAGLAGTHVDDDGFSHDTGAHFITNRLAAAVGVSAQCQTVKRYGETVWLGGRTHGYPMGLLAVPRYVQSAAAARLRANGSTPRSAADVFRRDYGAALADEVALPLLEAWSGAPADELSPAVADKVPSSLFQTLRLRAQARLGHRAVAVGYCNALPQSGAVYHVYPNDGVATVCRAVADDLDGVIRLESPVESVHVDDDAVTAVTVAGATTEVDAVVSTAPANVLPRLVQGTDRLDRFGALRFRPMVFVNLKLEGQNLLPDVVVWTPERHLPFFRLTEGSQSMPWTVPDGKTVIMADIGATVGDEHWTMDDTALTDLCLDAVDEIVPGVRRRSLGSHVIRTPIAYPVFHLDYESDRQLLERTTGVEGLLSVGRNGEFAHILMEDVYWRTIRRVDSWLDGSP